MSANKYQIDMCHGPILSKIALFALPLMLTYILQLLFNAVDLIVIGHYASPDAMAAVGSTMNLNALVINVFMGISVGTNVVAAKFFGSKNEDGMRRTVHTSIKVALYGGLILMIAGLLAAKPLLILMGTPEKILPLSCTYIWICFGAIPFIMIYNFGCAILRAVGDTRRPLFYLTFAGIVNVLLNLFLVISCGMDVGGVALATVISHAISALMILTALMSSREVYRLHLKKMVIDLPILKEMLKVGIPAGVQSSCFAISNMAIQSSINSFGALAMAGMTAALGLEGIVYVGSYAFHQTAISFVAQNLGGRKFKRILKSLYGCFICATGSCLVMGVGFYLIGETLLAIFNPHPEVIAWGLLRMKILFCSYFFCGIMDVASGGLRGLGYSLLSAVVSLFGACVFRMWWVFVIFPRYRTMESLLWSYPVSWILVAAISGTLLYWICRRMIRTHTGRKVAWSKLGPGVPKGYRWLGGSR